jgi:hypothetical protein
MSIPVVRVDESSVPRTLTRRERLASTFDALARSTLERAKA